MSHRVVCDSCDERVTRGEECVELSTSGEAGISTFTHYHDLCWERNVDHLLPRPILLATVMIRKRIA